MSDMSCHEIRDWLRCDFDGAAEPSGDVAAHLDRCDGCRSIAAQYRLLASDARRALPDPDVPVGFTARVMDVVDDASSDAVLADAVRPRWTRWWPAFVPVVLVAFVLWGRGISDFGGRSADGKPTDGDVSGGAADRATGAGAETDAGHETGRAEPKQPVEPLIADTAWSALLQRARSGDETARAELRTMRTRIDGVLRGVVLESLAAELRVDLQRAAVELDLVAVRRLKEHVWTARALGNGAGTRVRGRLNRLAMDAATAELVAVHLAELRQRRAKSRSAAEREELDRRMMALKVQYASEQTKETSKSRRSR